MFNHHLSVYLRFNKVSSKKLKSYYNIYCVAFKNYFWSIFGNFRSYAKKSRILLKPSRLKLNQQKRVCSQLNSFFSLDTSGHLLNGSFDG